MKILFLDTRNSCRSQMAEGLLRDCSAGVIEVVSAGIHPKPINPLAIRCMAEIGVDISAQHAKSLDPFLEQEFDCVVTLSDKAKEKRSAFPRASEHLHWSLPDTAALQGTDEERMQLFRKVREELVTCVLGLLGMIFENILQGFAHSLDTSHQLANWKHSPSTQGRRSKSNGTVGKGRWPHCEVLLPG